ncbi:Hypothetical predicted protein [Marmota monax]|uniref:Uncharacterized protein n=1 Tax=Marmota monax TaxID=9995 RepID=A0A5E4D7F4_MARMO|nr:Hypothetical predicted protein [Marmota monax]
MKTGQWLMVHHQLLNAVVGQLTSVATTHPLVQTVLLSVAQFRLLSVRVHFGDLQIDVGSIARMLHTFLPGYPASTSSKSWRTSSLVTLEISPMREAKLPPPDQGVAQARA